MIDVQILEEDLTLEIDASAGFFWNQRIQVLADQVTADRNAVNTAASDALQAIADAVAAGIDAIEDSHGYSPVLAVVADGDRLVFQVADWVGGTGTKPAAGQFIGPSGFVGAAAQAINIRGIPGLDGRELELRTTATHIQWRLEGDAGWADLIALSTLKGDTGASVELRTTATHVQWRTVGAANWINLIALSDLTGANGPAIELQVASSHIQWRVVGTASWINLIELEVLKGLDGRELVLQRGATHIQWRYEGDASWVDLVPLADIAGNDGHQVELRTTSTHIQWRYVTDPASSWVNLITLSDLTGDTGPAVELRTTATHIQWRAVGEPTWIDLITLSDLTGDTGPAIELQTSATHIQWRVVGNGTWIDLIALEDLQGDEGPPGDTHVPTPVGQPDGKILTVQSDALVYGDPPAIHPPPMFGHYMHSSLVKMWDTCQRPIVSPVSVFGEQTDSGHGFQGVSLTGTDNPVAEWHPDGYIAATSSPSSGNLGTDGPLTLIDWTPESTRISFGLVIERAHANASRHVILKYIDPDNYLYVTVATDVLWLDVVVDGVQESYGVLANGGNAANGLAALRYGAVQLIFTLFTTHGSHSAISFGVQASVNGRISQNPVGLPEGAEIFRDEVGKVGWQASESTRIYRFFGAEGSGT